jgi:putative flippase GtrA
MKETVEKFIRKYQDLIRYVLAGCCTTLFNLVTFTFAVKVIGMDVTISNIISVALSIIFAYIINRTFVFKSKTKKPSKIIIEAVKFISARFSTMLIEVGGVYLIVNILRQNEILGKIETQVIVFLLNYIISKNMCLKVTKYRKRKYS